MNIRRLAALRGYAPKRHLDRFSRFFPQLTTLGRAWIVQSYLPGGTNVDAELVHRAFGQHECTPNRHLDPFNCFCAVHVLSHLISSYLIPDLIYRN